MNKLRSNLTFIFLRVILITSTLTVSQQMMSIDCFVDVCIQLRQFDISARLAAMRPKLIVNAPSVPQNLQLSPALPNRASFAPSVYDCMDFRCLCPYFGGGLSPNGICHLRNGQPLQRAVRKEIRVLTDDERHRFFEAVRQLKASGEYDRLAVIHKQVRGAHSGPSFLPWHREFMKRMEIALRLIDPSVALPYWDSTLDYHLPNPQDSIMWSSFLMGETDSLGRVINGPFAGFTTLEGQPAITRRLGSEGHLFTDQNIAEVLAKNSIDGILAYTAPTQACPYPPNFSALEYYHASVHIWVGGDMKPPRTSANDPVFYLHHSFVDYIMEQWRQIHQNRFQREQEYPEEITTCTTPLHFANANMRPFNLINRQGLSNAYTDYLYTYAPRPTCSRQQRNCGSKFLFCDFRNGSPRCVTKIKLGKRCAEFGGQDACYMGICTNGYCTQVVTQPAAVTQHRLIPQPTRNTINPRMATSTPTCLNDDPCCSLWAARNECISNVEYMRMYCRRSCRYCQNPTNAWRGCFDRHISCPYMRLQGECTRKPQWMAENCQYSCGWCNLSAMTLCFRTALMTRRRA
ncbi:unnamed protein product [Thelazia callipaeda]|uniref:ShKT domain-containing protein n=1 Tax=Thelazia callipaeda TaxID=103827 RepID=A0A0N5D763_THECL|nr:unnamed protein product [Thelazia callipaeda]